MESIHGKMDRVWDTSIRRHRKNIFSPIPFFPRTDPCRRTFSILHKEEALSCETLVAKQSVRERVFTNFQWLKESQGETIFNRERGWIRLHNDMGVYTKGVTSEISLFLIYCFVYINIYCTWVSHKYQ
jgi:hypothetical protein